MKANNFKIPTWNTTEDLFLLDNHRFLTMDELCKQLLVPVSDIREKLTSFGIKKKNPVKTSEYENCENPICFTPVETSRIFCSEECSYLSQGIVFPSKAKIVQDLKKNSLEQLVNQYGISSRSLLILLDKYGISRYQKIQPKEVNKKFSIKDMESKTSKNMNSGYAKSGFRKDLGVYVRSSWEGNFLRYLNMRKKSWLYEPHTFWFYNIKKGTRSYTPDVLLDPKGDYQWVEVKGYLRPQDKTKIKRFKKYYPEEFERLVAVTKNENSEATKFFRSLNVPIYMFYDDLKKDFKEKINWEGR